MKKVFASRVGKTDASHVPLNKIAMSVKKANFYPLCLQVLIPLNISHFALENVGMDRFPTYLHFIS